MTAFTTSSTPLVNPVLKHNRPFESAPVGAAVAVAVVAPLWFGTIIPLSICYQLGKALLKPILPQPTPPPTMVDSGYVVDKTSLIPLKDRKYDIVVLGATGFTGWLAARYLAKTYGVNKTVKWAIAGRSQKKLDAVKEKLVKELGMEEIKTGVDTIIVDTSVTLALPGLVQDTRVVATTAGPYALYGSPVVELCAKFGTHYVDITGESDWVKNMHTMWHQTARASGAKIIPFCGHDCIPWDVLVMKLQEIMETETGDTMTQVTCWDQGNGGAPGGTFATIVSVITGMQPSPPVPDPWRFLPDGKTTSDYTVKKNLPLLFEKSVSPFEHDSTSSRWTIPFVMAALNSEVVGWSHALRSKGAKSLIYRESMVMPNFHTAFTAYTVLAMVGSTLFNPLTLKFIFQRFIAPKPGTGPDVEFLETKGYLCIAAQGVGEKGNCVQAYFYFPKDGGCTETVRMMIEAGLCMTMEDDANSKLPTAEGGLWTPSTALGNVLLQRLLDTGSTLDVRIVPAASGK